MNASIEGIAKLNLEIKESIEKIKPVIEHLQKITPDFIQKDWYLSGWFVDNDELAHLYFDAVNAPVLCVNSFLLIIS